jgi:hypothetical protein
MGDFIFGLQLLFSLLLEGSVFGAVSNNVISTTNMLPQ